MLMGFPTAALRAISRLGRCRKLGCFGAFQPPPSTQEIAPSQSNSPCTSQADAVPDRQRAREAGQASQEQQAMSNDTSALNATNTKQQPSATQGTGPQQQAGTNDSKKGQPSQGQPSPSRDQGHSPSGSSKTDASHQRSDNSPRQMGGKKN
ncbi:MAG: hypothetical protein ACI83N_001365 [Hydrogenophaga sp.]|jgi:hypothetical protein